jgi:DNA-binding XRE family transcriptional regulator
MATRRPNWRGVRRHRSYSVDEAARTVDVSKGTVRRWTKTGLPAITDRKPTLILGSDLIDFIKSRRQPKQRCQLDECYCFACRAPRRPAFNEVEYVPLTSTSGNLRALCIKCSTVMHKRVSTAILAVLGAIVSVTIKQADKPISKSDGPCLNDNFERET